MRKISALVWRILYKLYNSIKRFPEAVIFAVATVGLMILMNHWHVPDKIAELFKRIAMVLALGFPISLFLNLLSERYHKNQHKLKAVTYPIAVVMLIFYFVFWLKKIEYVTTSRYLAYNLAFYLAFLFIPYLFKENEKDFELYVIQLFTKFCITYLYSLTLYIGLSVILLTIDHLFGVKISNKLYFDVGLVIAGVFAPVYFLAELPKISRDYTHARLDDYPNVLRVLFIYFLMPIISVYTAILFAYFAKIMITRTWPSGLVSHLVLWYAILSTILIFFISPLRTENRAVERFSKLFHWLILPLLAMMFVAMGKRIEAFGITENRYYVLIAGCWITAWMLYSCFVKRPRHLILPVSLSIIMILAVTGPWSSFTASKFSQNKRFITLLQEYELLENNQIIPRQDLPGEAKKEISSIILYFKNNHSLHDLKPLPKDFEINDMEKIFGFKLTGRYYSEQDDNREYFFNWVEDDKQIVSIDGYEILADFYLAGNKEIINRKGVYHISYSQDRMLVITKDGEKLYSKNIEELVVTNWERFDPESKHKQNLILIVDQNKDLSVCYIFKKIRGWKDKITGTLEIEDMEFYLLIKSHL